MTTDARLAAHLADGAGALLLELRAKSGLTGKELGARGDAESDALLLRMLADQRPSDAVLSEESVDSPARLAADRVWIVDPLDGTREYGMPGRTDWAVHVALWQAGRGITDAAVAQPAFGAVYASDTVFAADLPADAGLAGDENDAGSADDTAAGSADRTSARSPLILVSDSRPPEFADAVATTVGGRLQPMGSAGAKAMAVLRGDADAYLHAGGQWEWDSAAPVGVAIAAGLHASRIDGTPLTYNNAHPYLPDLLICRAPLAGSLLEAIAAAVG
jgi:3'(2'), 5'-bisphosphate nucleotidase